MATTNLGLNAPTYAPNAVKSVAGGYGQANDQMRNDWNGFFGGTANGAAVDWGGGKLQNMGNGKAYFSSADIGNGGAYINQSDIDNPETLRNLMASSPGIAQEWAKYGLQPDTSRVQWEDKNRQQRYDSGQAIPGIPVHGGDIDVNSAYFQNNKNDPIASYVRDFTKQNPSQYHTNTDWAGQYGLSPQGQPSQPQAQNTQAQPAQANGQQSMQNLGMGGQQPAQPTMQNMGSPRMDAGRNSYLQQVGQALTAQSNQNLKQNILPGIGQGAQAAGMYGSSRQGVAEGVAMGNAQTGLNSALANMYSQGYGQDQQYDLGLRNNSLGYSNLDANNQQFGAKFGLESQDYQNRWANNSVDAANKIAGTPWNQFNQSAGLSNNIAGQGGSTTQNNQGNPWLGFLGGAQIGSQFGGKP